MVIQVKLASGHGLPKRSLLKVNPAVKIYAPQENFGGATSCFLRTCGIPTENRRTRERANHLACLPRATVWRERNGNHQPRRASADFVAERRDAATCPECWE